jgi:hypothetical protein
MKHQFARIGFIIFLVGIIFLFIPLSFALASSNDSIQAKKLIDKAGQEIIEMELKNISVLRVNESYTEAIQIYSAQLALEEKGVRADFKLVTQYTSNIDSIKESALKAKDELEIFDETYKNAEKETNLSAMSDDYNQIILSFQEERFEDTLKLINTGYETLSEVQSRQAGLRMFYSSTTQTVKDFFVKQGLKIAIILLVLLVLLLIFWKILKKLRMRIKLNNLITQKGALNNLIKKIQYDYFKSRKISESEYTIKLKRFEELRRDISRQIMAINEEIFKLDKKKET